MNISRNHSSIQYNFDKGVGVGSSCILLLMYLG